MIAHFAADSLRSGADRVSMLLQMKRKETASSDNKTGSNSASKQKNKKSKIDPQQHVVTAAHLEKLFGKAAAAAGNSGADDDAVMLVRFCFRTFQLFTVQFKFIFNFIVVVCSKRRTVQFQFQFQ